MHMSDGVEGVPWGSEVFLTTSILSDCMEWVESLVGRGPDVGSRVCCADKHIVIIVHVLRWDRVTSAGRDASFVMLRRDGLRAGPSPSSEREWA